MCVFRIAWTLKQVKKKSIKIDSKKVKGYFIWIGSCGAVDRIVGYHKKRGFIADMCYYSKKKWYIQLWKTIWNKKGFIHITRFI